MRRIITDFRKGNLGIDQNIFNLIRVDLSYQWGAIATIKICVSIIPNPLLYDFFEAVISRPT